LLEPKHKNHFLQKYDPNEVVRGSMSPLNNTIQQNIINTNTDPISQFNPSSSMKNIPILQSSIQFQQTPFNQFIQSNLNQFPNMMENNISNMNNMNNMNAMTNMNNINNMNPLMNSGYIIPNSNNNPFLQNNLNNPYSFNQYAYNALTHNNPYLNYQANQQAYNLNMNQLNNMNNMSNMNNMNAAMIRMNNMSNMNNMNLNNLNTPQINTQEYMQMKVNLTNFESENLALKQKLIELNKIQSTLKSKEKENSDVIRENFQLKVLVETLTADKIALGRELEEASNNNDNIGSEKLDEIERNYNRIIKGKDQSLRKNKEDIEKMKTYIENLKKENAKLK
jgi:hypothetical protein